MTLRVCVCVYPNPWSTVYSSTTDFTGPLWIAAMCDEESFRKERVCHILSECGRHVTHTSRFLKSSSKALGALEYVFHPNVELTVLFFKI